MSLQRREEPAAVTTVLAENFGQHHDGLLIYIEARCVDHGGYPDPSHMRCNPARHPSLCSELVHPTWASWYSTKLRDGTVVDGHDDWDVVNDLVAAGLVTLGKYAKVRLIPQLWLTDAGWQSAHELRRSRANDRRRSLAR